MNSLKVSVIIPVYKVEKYLDECMNSVVTQRFDSFEIICVNDCSPDNSLEILQSYQAKYDNIRVINNKTNMGLSSSRNVGLEAATGKYVLFVDSDDYIKKGTLDVLYNRMEKDGLDIAYFNKKYFYELGCAVENRPNDRKRFGEAGVFTGKEMFTRFHLADSFKSMNAYTQFFSRDFLIRNDLRFYEGIVHEDYLFYFLCAMKAERVGNFDKSFYCYRKRNDSITGVLTPIRKQSVFVTLSEIIDYWKSNTFSSDENEAIERFCAVILRSCQNYKENCNSRDKLQFSDSADKFLYKYLMNTQFVYIRDKEWEKLYQSNRIWIYGAGKVAHELVSILAKRNIQVLGVLLTKKSEKIEKFYGWNVYDINEADIQKNDLVILSAAGNYKKEMAKVLKSKGIHNVICASKDFDN